MVSGAFSLLHRLPLYLMNGNLTAACYMDEILTRFALPLLRQIEPQAVYQDDNARPYRARTVDAYNQQVGIKRMDWPACSPNLHPTEHLWDELDRRARNNHTPPTDSQHLFQILHAEWQALLQRYFTAVITSMRRCNECLANNNVYRHY